MPSCMLADGLVLNPSRLTADSFWHGSQVTLPRADGTRAAPRHRWIGAVPCACILEALELFSLERSPSPAEWPSLVVHPQISMQRVVCLDTAEPVGAAWQSGRRSQLGHVGLRP